MQWNMFRNDFKFRESHNSNQRQIATREIDYHKQTLTNNSNPNVSLFDFLWPTRCEQFKKG